ncbi:Phosphatidylinositol 4-kinase gamma 4 [Porphyridium purpureum]|uniref:Phosphatidylinositol 4-kinase gamma 4 n=1 Tax=Porphyridium purpureum TaxID=35688 RepID=A0A5J4YPM1_PORPP|nr:Phosphatidylinositol 4-kinase gamma 4 [Porphyridium purpureum]|eukprot:POR2465..scf296_7
MYSVSKMAREGMTTMMIGQPCMSRSDHASAAVCGHARPLQNNYDPHNQKSVSVRAPRSDPNWTVPSENDARDECAVDPKPPSLACSASASAVPVPVPPHPPGPNHSFFASSSVTPGNVPFATSWHYTEPALQERNENFKILSRGARRFGKSSNLFEPWDFSEIINAKQSLSALPVPVCAERPSRTGVCGSYFIRGDQNSRDILGVFKPVDEEAVHMLAEAFDCDVVSGILQTGLQAERDALNPAGGQPRTTASSHYSSHSDSGKSGVSPRTPGLEHCFPPGTGAFREIAAYLLDHHHVSGVPQTCLAQLKYTVRGSSSTTGSCTKVGAFQHFESNLGDADDFGPGVFMTENVQAIATLDIRMLNCDRHAGNLLVVPSDMMGKYKLVPIDHGYALGEWMFNCPWPVWMDWPQAREPVSAALRDEVRTLDAGMDAKILKEELQGGIGLGALVALRIATHLLQRGCEAGLSLYEIGRLVYTRSPETAPSELHKIAAEAVAAGFAREHRLDDEHDRDNLWQHGLDDSDGDMNAEFFALDMADEEHSGSRAGGTPSSSQSSPSCVIRAARSSGRRPWVTCDNHSDLPTFSRSASGFHYEVTSSLAPLNHHGSESEQSADGERFVSEASADFIVKYACKLIDERVQILASEHERQAQGGTPVKKRGGLGGFGGKTRSIPDSLNSLDTTWYGRAKRHGPSSPVAPHPRNMSVGASPTRWKLPLLNLSDGGSGRARAEGSTSERVGQDHAQGYSRDRKFDGLPKMQGALGDLLFFADVASPVSPEREE